MGKNQVNVSIFTNSEFGDVGIILIEGKVYFPATQCAKILGYTNPYDAIIRHCKRDGVVKHEGVSFTTNQYGVTTQQTVEIKYIDEGNLYRLIVGSKLPAAERFEHWIFDEVLPSIRKTGGYVMDGRENEFINNPDLPLYEKLNNIESFIQKMSSYFDTQQEQKIVYGTRAIEKWKSEIGKPYKSKVAQALNVDDKEAYSRIYGLMKTTYGFSIETAKLDFLSDYGFDSMSIIDTIAAYKDYRAEYIECVNEILRSNMIINQREDCPDEDDNSSLLDFESIVDKIVKPLAKKLDDNSIHYGATLRKIYRKMKTERGWKSTMAKRHCKSKKHIILNDDKLLKQLRDIVAEMLNDTDTEKIGV